MSAKLLEFPPVWWIIKDLSYHETLAWLMKYVVVFRHLLSEEIVLDGVRG